MDNNFGEKIPKFSIVKACPRCNELALTAKKGRIFCTNCGYEQEVPTVR